MGSMVLSLTEGRHAGDPVFRSQKGERRLTDRAVNHLLKRLAAKAGIDPRFSAHWLRHAHASHTLDGGAPVSLVAGTPGHANIATTSVYLHAKPGTSSADKLGASVWEAK
jgi:site-specific recombinase XerD